MVRRNVSAQEKSTFRATGSDAHVAPRGWVRVKLPAEFRVGERGLAERCGWRVKAAGDAFFVCTNESYRKTAPRLLVATRLANYGNAGDSTAYERLARWPPQDQ